MNHFHKLTADCAWPVHGTDSSRTLEAVLQAQQATPLMQLAGLATAQLALAVAPHAQRIWVAAGPGNNGGDGLEAALHLHQWGKSVAVQLMGPAELLPTDARNAWQRATAAGVPISSACHLVELQGLGPKDLIIDALLGIGAARPLQSNMKSWVQAINQASAQVLAVDVPTGLNADSGQFWAEGPDTHCIQADHTLTFITAKPGLFMGHGRDMCGHIWWAPLGWGPQTGGGAPDAWLNSGPIPAAKKHASHKGSHGDVAVIGGAADVQGMGMTGAAVLAATAALYAGAGRVIVSLLSGQATDTAGPDLMQRDVKSLDLAHLHVVCGCGGGESVKSVLPEVLQQSKQLVLDADGLNALAQDPQLKAALLQRRGTQATVLTPHPLEAARLLNTSTTLVQTNRLKAAQDLVDMYQCTVVLKGSGTVIASPGETPRINPTGNGQLAMGGTGDVLAGLIGARMAQGMNAFEAACSAVAQHGQVADEWPVGHALTASRLAKRLV
jgi:hydroxyethylthiazole kinase-like uncharacterized protein yjeF